MNNYFIILAAGKGQRFKQNKPKQFFDYNGKVLIDENEAGKLIEKLKIIENNQNTTENNRE